MNESVIQELANQLGIAATDIEGRVLDLLPSYYAFKQSGAMVGMVAFAVPITLLVVFLFVMKVVTDKENKEYGRKRTIMDTVFEDCTPLTIFLVLLFASTISGICFIACAYDWYIWSVNPEAAMLQEVLKAM